MAIGGFVSLFVSPLSRHSPCQRLQVSLNAAVTVTCVSSLKHRLVTRQGCVQLMRFAMGLTMRLKNRSLNIFWPPIECHR